MKTKKTIHTYVLNGRIEMQEFCREIFKKTGMRFILEDPGQELNGSINGYYRTENEKEYTIFDIFFYDEDVKIETDGKTRNHEHSIKRIFLTKKKVESMEKTIKQKYIFAEDITANVILNKLGINQ